MSSPACGWRSEGFLLEHFRWADRLSSEDRNAEEEAGEEAAEAARAEQRTFGAVTEDRRLVQKLTGKRNTYELRRFVIAVTDAEAARHFGMARRTPSMAAHEGVPNETEKRCGDGSDAESSPRNSTTAEALHSNESASAYSSQSYDFAAEPLPFIGGGPRRSRPNNSPEAEQTNSSGRRSALPTQRSAQVVMDALMPHHTTMARLSAALATPAGSMAACAAGGHSAVRSPQQLAGTAGLSPLASPPPIHDVRLQRIHDAWTTITPVPEAHQTTERRRLEAGVAERERARAARRAAAEALIAARLEEAERLRREEELAKETAEQRRRRVRLEERMAALAAEAAAANVVPAAAGTEEATALALQKEESTPKAVKASAKGSLPPVAVRTFNVSLFVIMEAVPHTMATLERARWRLATASAVADDDSAGEDASAVSEEGRGVSVDVDGEESAGLPPRAAMQWTPKEMRGLLTACSHLATVASALMEGAAAEASAAAAEAAVASGFLSAAAAASSSSSPSAAPIVLSLCKETIGCVTAADGSLMASGFVFTSDVFRHPHRSENGRGKTANRPKSARGGGEEGRADCSSGGSGWGYTADRFLRRGTLSDWADVTMEEAAARLTAVGGAAARRLSLSTGMEWGAAPTDGSRRRSLSARRLSATPSPFPPPELPSSQGGKRASVYGTDGNRSSIFRAASAVAGGIAAGGTTAAVASLSPAEADEAEAQRLALVPPINLLERTTAAEAAAAAKGRCTLVPLAALRSLPAVRFAMEQFDASLWAHVFGDVPQKGNSNGSCTDGDVGSGSDENGAHHSEERDSNVPNKTRKKKMRSVPAASVSMLLLGLLLLDVLLGRCSAAVGRQHSGERGGDAAEEDEATRRQRVRSLIADSAEWTAILSAVDPHLSSLNEGVTEKEREGSQLISASDTVVGGCPPLPPTSSSSWLSDDEAVLAFYPYDVLCQWFEGEELSSLSPLTTTGGTPAERNVSILPTNNNAAAGTTNALLLSPQQVALLEAIRRRAAANGAFVTTTSSAEEAPPPHPLLPSHRRGDSASTALSEGSGDGKKGGVSVACDAPRHGTEGPKGPTHGTEGPKDPTVPPLQPPHSDEPTPPPSHLSHPSLLQSKLLPHHPHQYNSDREEGNQPQRADADGSGSGGGGVGTEAERVVGVGVGGGLARLGSSETLGSSSTYPLAFDAPPPAAVSNSPSSGSSAVIPPAAVIFSAATHSHQHHQQSGGTAPAVVWSAMNATNAAAMGGGAIPPLASNNGSSLARSTSLASSSADDGDGDGRGHHEDGQRSKVALPSQHQQQQPHRSAGSPSRARSRNNTIRTVVATSHPLTLSQSQSRSYSQPPSPAPAAGHGIGSVGSSDAPVGGAILLSPLLPRDHHLLLDGSAPTLSIGARNAGGQMNAAHPNPYASPPFPLPHGATAANNANTNTNNTVAGVAHHGGGAHMLPAYPMVSESITSAAGFFTDRMASSPPVIRRGNPRGSVFEAAPRSTAAVIGMAFVAPLEADGGASGHSSFHGHGQAAAADASFHSNFTSATNFVPTKYGYPPHAPMGAAPLSSARHGWGTSLPYPFPSASAAGQGDIGSSRSVSMFLHSASVSPSAPPPLSASLVGNAGDRAHGVGTVGTGSSWDAFSTVGSAAAAGFVPTATASSLSAAVSGDGGSGSGGEGEGRRSSTVAAVVRGTSPHPSTSEALAATRTPERPTEEGPAANVRMDASSNTEKGGGGGANVMAVDFSGDFSADDDSLPSSPKAAADGPSTKTSVGTAAVAPPAAAVRSSAALVDTCTTNATTDTLNDEIPPTEAEAQEVSQGGTPVASTPPPLAVRSRFEEMFGAGGTAAQPRKRRENFIISAIDAFLAEHRRLVETTAGRGTTSNAGSMQLEGGASGGGTVSRLSLPLPPSVPLSASAVGASGSDTWAPPPCGEPFSPTRPSSAASARRASDGGRRGKGGALVVSRGASLSVVPSISHCGPQAVGQDASTSRCVSVSSSSSPSPPSQSATLLVRGLLAAEAHRTAYARAYGWGGVGGGGGRGGEGLPPRALSRSPSPPKSGGDGLLAAHLRSLRGGQQQQKNGGQKGRDAEQRPHSVNGTVLTDAAARLVTSSPSYKTIRGALAKASLGDGASLLLTALRAREAADAARNAPPTRAEVLLLLQSIVALLVGRRGDIATAMGIEDSSSPCDASDACSAEEGQRGGNACGTALIGSSNSLIVPTSTATTNATTSGAAGAISALHCSPLLSAPNALLAALAERHIGLGRARLLAAVGGVLHRSAGSDSVESRDNGSTPRMLSPPPPIFVRAMVTPAAPTCTVGPLAPSPPHRPSVLTASRLGNTDRQPLRQSLSLIGGAAPSLHVDGLIQSPRGKRASQSQHNSDGPSIPPANLARVLPTMAPSPLSPRPPSASYSASHSGSVATSRPFTLRQTATAVGTALDGSWLVPFQPPAGAPAGEGQKGRTHSLLSPPEPSGHIKVVTPPPSPSDAQGGGDKVHGEDSGAAWHHFLRPCPFAASKVAALGLSPIAVGSAASSQRSNSRSGHQPTPSAPNRASPTPIRAVAPPSPRRGEGGGGGRGASSAPVPLSLRLSLSANADRRGDLPTNTPSSFLPPASPRQRQPSQQHRRRQQAQQGASAGTYGSLSALVDVFPLATSASVSSPVRPRGASGRPRGAALPLPLPASDVPSTSSPQRPYYSADVMRVMTAGGGGYGRR